MNQLTKSKLFITTCIISLACILLGCEKSKEEKVKNEEMKTSPSIETLNSVTAITVSNGSLSPEFKEDIISYELIVPNGTDTVSINPQCANDPCNFSLTQSGNVINNPISLSNNNEDITLTVIESTNKEKKYTISLKIDSNLIKNSSFEQVENDSLLHWTIISSGTFISENNILSLHGSKIGYFPKLTSSISGREIQSDSFAIDNTQSIELSAYFYTSIDPSHTKISLKIWYFQDESCTITATDESNTQRSLNLDSKDTWQKVTYFQTTDHIPSDANYAKMSIRVMYDKKLGSSSDIVYFDNIHVLQNK